MAAFSVLFSIETAAISIEIRSKERTYNHRAAGFPGLTHRAPYRSPARASRPQHVLSVVIPNVHTPSRVRHLRSQAISQRYPWESSCVLGPFSHLKQVQFGWVGLKKWSFTANFY